MEMETEIFLIFQLYRYRCLASRHDVVVCLPGFVTDGTVKSTWPRCLVEAQMVRQIEQVDLISKQLLAYSDNGYAETKADENEMLTSPKSADVGW
jgi:hypothetical protein